MLVCAQKLLIHYKIQDHVHRTCLSSIAESFMPCRSTTLPTLHHTNRHMFPSFKIYACSSNGRRIFHVVPKQLKHPWVARRRRKLQRLTCSMSEAQTIPQQNLTALLSVHTLQSATLRLFIASRLWTFAPPPGRPESVYKAQTQVMYLKKHLKLLAPSLPSSHSKPIWLPPRIWLDETRS
jgi:hypothetical protein